MDEVRTVVNMDTESIVIHAVIISAGRVTKDPVCVMNAGYSRYVHTNTTV